MDEEKRIENLNEMRLVPFTKYVGKGGFKENAFLGVSKLHALILGKGDPKQFQEYEKLLGVKLLTNDSILPLIVLSIVKGYNKMRRYLFGVAFSFVDKVIVALNSDIEYAKEVVENEAKYRREFTKQVEDYASRIYEDLLSRMEGFLGLGKIEEGDVFISETISGGTKAPLLALYNRIKREGEAKRVTREMLLGWASKLKEILDDEEDEDIEKMSIEEQNKSSLTNVIDTYFTIKGSMSELDPIQAENKINDAKNIILTSKPITKFNLNEPDSNYPFTKKNVVNLLNLVDLKKYKLGFTKEDIYLGMRITPL